MDCDGVLTDGRLYFSSSGEELKVFDVRDGQGIVMWHQAGFKSGIISGRGARDIVARRAEELGIEFLRVGTTDKLADLREIMSEVGVSAENVAYVGDDIGDIAIMREVGFPVAVADAVDAVKKIAAYVTKAAGGRGAVREVTDLLLQK